MYIRTRCCLESESVPCSAFTLWLLRSRIRLLLIGLLKKFIDFFHCITKTCLGKCIEPCNVEIKKSPIVSTLGRSHFTILVNLIPVFFLHRLSISIYSSCHGYIEPSVGHSWSYYFPLPNRWRLGDWSFISYKLNLNSFACHSKAFHTQAHQIHSSSQLHCLLSFSAPASKLPSCWTVLFSSNKPL